MIEDWYIDPATSDVAVDDLGNFLWVEGSARVRQHAQARLDIQRGDWFRDSTVGVDWLGKVLVKGTTTVIAQAEIVRELNLVAGIATIDAVEFAIDPQTRALSVVWSATTDEDIAIGGAITG